MRKPYPTDLSDTEWIRLRSYLPTPKAQGRPRTHSLREVLDAIFYVLKSGCPWRLLPHDFPPWPTVYYHFRKLRIRGSADRSWHSGRTTFPAVAAPAPSNEPPDDDVYLREGYPEVDLTLPLRAPHELFAGVVPGAAPLHDPPLGGC